MLSSPFFAERGYSSPRHGSLRRHVVSDDGDYHQQSTTARRYRPPMNPFNADLSKAKTFARLETGTLKDVTDDYYYGCFCTSCLHTARLSLAKLRVHLGGRLSLDKNPRTPEVETE
jgi:hypothetical protein